MYTSDSGTQSISENLMKLLIVDDNEEIRKILKSMYSHMFYQISECDDGDLAIESYDNEKPDWVFMDIKMKRVDGITATKRIINKYPKAKIIIVSQYNDKDFIEAAKNSGAIEFVSKEDLTKIEAIISGRKNN
jgi:NarL family two-component system response regulator LiaR